MTVITITRQAKCKDCKYCMPLRIGKKRVHKCSNINSLHNEHQIALKNYVCNNWAL